MKKLNALIITVLLFQADLAFACPTCMGANENDKYYLWVIGVFVLAIYFPMFYLFKTFNKFKGVNSLQAPTEE